MFRKKELSSYKTRLGYSKHLKQRPFLIKCFSILSGHMQWPRNLRPMEDRKTFSFFKRVHLERNKARDLLCSFLCSTLVMLGAKLQKKCIRTTTHRTSYREEHLAPTRSFTLSLRPFLISVVKEQPSKQVLKISNFCLLVSTLTEANSTLSSTTPSNKEM